MPNRMIRESCRTSETLNQLSAEAERLFWRLTTVADDFGRFEADPRVILATCFPLKVGLLKVETVGRWFKELVACSLVRTYVSGCKQLAFFVTWEKHQYTRAKTSKYPAPASVSTCEQTPTDSLVVTGSTVVTERHETTESRAPSAPALSSGANGHDPTAAFPIPDDILRALDRAPTLGHSPRLRSPIWWQAEIRANGPRGVDFAAEVLRAEAWIASNPARAPRKDHARFLHTWLARAEGDDA